MASQERPGRNPDVWGDHGASHAGSSTCRTNVCRALSWWVGMPRGRFSGLPRFGIHARLSGVAWLVRCSLPASRSRWDGVNDFVPSLPAVCLPRLSWRTRRTAHKRASQDVSNRFGSVCTVLPWPRCVAGDMRFWRRKTCRWTFFQGMSCQAAIRAFRSCVFARNLGRTALPFSTPARRQHSRGATPGLGFFGPLSLPPYMVGPDSVRGPPPRERLEGTPFPASIGRILRPVLSTGFLGRAYRSVAQGAGAVSCALLAPACQPLTLVSAHGGSTTPALALSIAACETGYSD